jgi:RNA polymerase sigma factor (sigma-70 family)
MPCGRRLGLLVFLHSYWYLQRMHALWPNVQAFHPQLWRAVCGYELNPALREELLQEVLLAIWESLPRLREPDLLLAFVLRIAHNLGASHVRSETRVPTPLPFDEALHDMADTDARDSNARSQWLFQALATLPLNLRQVLMLQLEGFDYQEIADMTGISAENVGVRLHRARERLKALSKQEAAQ